MAQLRYLVSREFMRICVWLFMQVFSERTQPKHPFQKLSPPVESCLSEFLGENMQVKADAGIHCILKTD